MTAAPAPTAGHGRGSPSTGRLLWGMAMLGAGVAWLLDAAGVADVAVARVVAVALIALGGVVAFLPARDRGSAVALGMVLVLVAVLTIVARPVGDLALVRHGVGDQHVAPASASQLQASYDTVSATWWWTCTGSSCRRAPRTWRSGWARATCVSGSHLTPPSASTRAPGWATWSCWATSVAASVPRSPATSRARPPGTP